ncbi:LuxR C-terminal-related transcriptional regulator [Microbacterium koreense]|uniref:LuxR C-terminal-related transcriptional regulator n=1 Tax=Microbacterium koreense TaxID=323761 RepID=A0ABW2ZNN9_9MICO
MERALERIVQLISEDRYAEAEEDTRGLSLVSLTGPLAGIVTRRNTDLSRRWNQMRGYPALVALVALGRYRVSGDIRSMDADLRAAADSLASHRSPDPVRRARDLVLQALCLGLADRGADSVEIGLRATALIDDLGPRLGEEQDRRIATAAIDLAGLLLVLDEYEAATRMCRVTRARTHDPFSPMWRMADIGLMCVAEITGSRGAVRAPSGAASDPQAGDGMWRAMLFVAKACLALDAMHPEEGLMRSQEAVGMFPDPYSLGPLVSVHATMLIAAGHPSWAGEFLDTVERVGLSTTPTTAVGDTRLLMRSLAAAASGDMASALRAEARMDPASPRRNLAQAYRLLWQGDNEGVVAVGARVARDRVTARHVGFLSVVLAAAHLRQGRESQTIADMERAGREIGMQSLGGAVLMLPRSDVIALLRLIDERGTVVLRRALPQPEQAMLADHPSPTLTGREREVLSLAAMGLTNPLIAERMHISANTVKYHLARAYRALGVATRARAVERAEEIGALIDVTPDAEAGRTSPASGTRG